MNGDEIGGVIKFAVAQPELPDIGIGDGNGDLRLDRADRSGKVGSFHISVQQHLVSDHERGDGSRIFTSKTYARRDLRQILLLVPTKPNSLNDFQPHLGRKFGNLIETQIGRIGTNAVGYFGKLGKIFRDLFPRHLRRRRK